ncbi:MAG: hypothetical protein LBN99_04160 [Oscillospiraceae bacterium]|jgi:hypothetical protein|nr:hypothetical protein [Oscillospiraceae bacterium]
MSRAARENLKTLLIAALLVSAVLLGRASGMFTGLVSAFSRTGAPTSAIVPGGVAETVSAEAARPGVIVLTDVSGARAVAKYDPAALDAMYERTSGIVGEALGASPELSECDEEEWRQALRSPGVMFEYYAPAPLGVVRGWLGAREDEDTQIRRLCLTFSGDASALYFQGDGGFYRAETAALGSAPTVPAVYDDSHLYEFEKNPDSAAPYVILIAGSSHPSVVSSNPLTSAANVNSILSSLGIDNQQKPGYSGSDGTLVYVTNSFTLSISPDGTVIYRRSRATGAAEPPEDAETGVFSDSTAVELARLVVAGALGAHSGDARVYFSGFEKRGAAATVIFDYFIAGGRVFLQYHDNAARVTITDGVITYMSLCFRSYTPDAEVTLLPEAQTLAARAGEFGLGYSDAGSGALSPFWYGLDASEVTP